jgi:hypothetical protein
MGPPVLGARGSSSCHRSSQAAAASVTAASSVPRCRTGHLAAGLNGAEISGRHVGFILTLTNTGPRSCSLFGYPGLGLQDSAHRALPSRAHWGSTFFDRNPGKALLVLSPGETASASFAFRAARSGGVQATYLVVTPPNAHAHRVLRFSRAMTVPIAGGNLHATAMARHTQHP